MSDFRASHYNVFYRIAQRLRHAGPYLFIPLALVAIASLVAFRHPSAVAFSDVILSDTLELPPGWSAPPIPADNPITSAKFVLGRQLFYETKLSGDDSTSCASCHQQKYSFASPKFPQPGAFGNFNNPVRRVPRIVNVAYDSVLFWDGHATTLEQQVHLAVLGHGDLGADTNRVFTNLSKNPTYSALFNQAFGTPTITLDRIAMAIATFERCLISGNSPYDQYLNGNKSAMSASATRGMNLFFDTSKTNCSHCHNNLGLTNPNSQGNLFTDCNYYRTGTFEPPGGYGGPDSNADIGREIVTHDSTDLGKFRTPTLRNVALAPPYGADGSVRSLQIVIENYNMGGSDSGFGFGIFNQDTLIVPLNLTQQNQQDLLAFLQSLTDSTFITNPDFQNPGPLSIVEDGHIISANLSVYPNPASSIVTVECPELTGATRASLVSDGGTIVWRRTLNADGRPFQLDFTDVSNGVYRLELNAGEVQQAINIVLKR